MKSWVIISNSTKSKTVQMKYIFLLKKYNFFRYITFTIFYLIWRKSDDDCSDTQTHTPSSHTPTHPHTPHNLDTHEASLEIWTSANTKKYKKKITKKRTRKKQEIGSGQPWLRQKKKPRLK